jgi:cytochrome c oxidase subunit 2
VGLELPKRVRNLAVGVAAGSGLLFLSGCSAEDKDQIKRLAMPSPASKEAHYIYDLWQGAWLAAIITGILVWGLIFYAVIKYRRRSETEIPVQTRYNLPIEIFYTIAPVMMVIVFFFFTVRAQDKVLPDETLAQANAKADLNVTVVGQQWSWTFNYVKGGTDQTQTVWEGGTPGGTKDNPTLWLVKDKTVSFDLYSPDVIHSFWPTNFLFKMDVVPGRAGQNHFTVTPNKYGTFVGRCAELCGVYHSRMLFNVKVVDQADFDAHLKALAALKDPNTGVPTNVGLNAPGPYEDEVHGLEHNNGEVE